MAAGATDTLSVYDDVVALIDAKEARKIGAEENIKQKNNIIIQRTKTSRSGSANKESKN